MSIPRQSALTDKEFVQTRVERGACDGILYSQTPNSWRSLLNELVALHWRQTFDATVAAKYRKWNIPCGTVSFQTRTLKGSHNQFMTPERHLDAAPQGHTG